MNKKSIVKYDYNYLGRYSMKNNEKKDRIPNNWEWINLGEVLELIYGKALPQKKRSGFGYPVFGSNGIVGYHSENIVEGPLIIVGRKGSNGEVNWYEDAGWPIDTTYHVKLKYDVDLEFIFYLLKSLELKKLNRATAIPGLNREDAYSQIVALPPKPEQKRIANKIKNLFQKITEAKQLIAEAKSTCEYSRAAILDKAFKGELSKQWRNANESKDTAIDLFPNIEEKKSLKNDPLDSKILEKLYELPSGWKWIRLNDLIESSNYGTSSKTLEESRGTPVLRMGNIVDGKLRMENLKYLPSDHIDVQKLKLETNDLLFNRTNSYELVGKTAVVPENLAGNTTFASYLIKVSLYSKNILANYICYYINSHIGRNFLMTMVTQQVGQANINSKKLAALPVPLPPKEEAQEISLLLNSYFEKENRAKELLSLQEYIETTKKSILSKALCGELATNEPTEEKFIELLKNDFEDN